MPVISVGNLAMGGRGKTPVAIHLARVLIAAGERPAVLSRGYGRRRVEDGAVVVSDGRHLLADLDRSGDEPLLVARVVRGAVVVVCEQRAVARALAECALGATVHVLDDGFQHRAIARAVDLVIVSPRDLTDRRLPFGRLRQPVRALAAADVIVMDAEQHGDADAPDVTGVAVLRDKPVFSLRRTLGPAVPLEPDRPWLAGTGPVLALAGIARPERFAQSLRAAGWSVARTSGYPDHYPYDRRDLTRIADAAREAGASAVVTTEKDAMRLLPLRPLPLPIASVPLDVTIEPAAAFQSWLAGRLAEARA
jgi:tetraacyldisaccharide 4'-kinase